MYCPINRSGVCWQEECAWWNTDMQKCCMALLSINQPAEEKTCLSPSTVCEDSTLRRIY